MLNDLIRGHAQPARFTTAPPDLAIVGLYRATLTPGVYEFIVRSSTFDPFEENADPPTVTYEYMT